MLRVAITLGCVLAGSAPLAQAQAEPAVPAVDLIDEILETVLVTGEQPGPGLWKVSKDDHVMWVLATYGPLPKGMTWRAKQVEARIAESQEVLLGGNIGIVPNIGILRGITLIPAALKAGKNPDGQTLKQVLPPDTYARWLALRQKYIGKDDDIEEWRPVIALGQLQGKAMQKHGLGGGPSVDAAVNAAAKKHKVRIHKLKNVQRVVRVEDPRGMLKAARRVEAPDLACFTRDLGELEPGIERSKARANAWARGDVAKLRELEQGNRKLEDECGYVLISAITEGRSADAAHLKKLMADAMWHAEWAGVQAQQEWLAAAQAALAKNKSTFTVLGLNDVLSPDGTLEKLRKLGYTVEAPL
jgi:hypothetical protein